MDCWVNGEWTEASSGEVVEIRNPANGETVDTVPRFDDADTRTAVDAAEEAFDEWSGMAAEKRASILRDAAEGVRDALEEIASLLTQEQGKPLSESKREIGHFLHGLEYFAGLLPTLRGDFVDLPQPDMHGVVMHQPIGVCGAIIPWNFPITLMGNKIGPGLAAGNTFVVKPASSTPLASIRTVEAMHEAGLPDGVLNIVTGPGSEVGEELLQNETVRRIGFTGETGTGRHVGEVAGRQLKRVSLELGGADPMILCDDAVLKRAISHGAVGRFYNCGQACLAVKRLYVFDSIYDEVVEGFAAKAEKLAIGDPMDEDTRIGPLHTAEQREEVEAQVADAVDRGAEVVAGGGRPEGAEFEKGFYYEPTVITDAPHDSRVSVEETFGPVLPIWPVSGLDEAIERANDHQYGLGSSIWTQDMTQANEAARRLEAGNVWINSLHYGHDEMPFGGVKASGLGREHGKEALLSYLEPKGVVYTHLEDRS